MRSFAEYLAEAALSDETKERMIDLYTDPKSVDLALEKGVGLFRWIAGQLGLHALTVQRKMKEMGLSDPVTRSMIAVQKWKTPEIRKKREEGLRRVLGGSEARSNMSKAAFDRNEDPEYQRKNLSHLSALNFKQWQDAEYRERISKFNKEKMKAYWADKDFWVWLSGFDDEKQQQILKAVYVSDRVRKRDRT